jgi:thiol-disulfide isomerase/thioredoxin
MKLISKLENSKKLRKAALASALACSIVGFVFSSSPAFASDQATLEAISKKIDRLQASMSARMDKLEKAVDGIKQGGGDPEAGAKAAFREIHGLVGNNKFEEAKASLAKFKKDHGNSSLMPHAVRLEREVAVVGKKTPKDWKIEKWLQGEDKISLESKKPTLVVFWELWCPHCQREVPKIQELYKKYSPKGFQIVALTKMSRGKTEKEIMGFLEENKVSYPAGKEDGSVSEYFAVSGIPAAVVLKDGKVAWRGHPARITEEMINDWI